jgi:hypothetical protein
LVKVILKWKPVGNRRIGRPSGRWLDDVCKDMKVINVKNWRELALNGNPRGCLAQKVKPTKVCKLMEEEAEKKTPYPALRCISNCMLLNILEI